MLHSLTIAPSHETATSGITAMQCPGDVWDARHDLDQADKKKLDSHAIFRMKEGQLLIDVNQVEAVCRENATVRTLLSKFVNAVQTQGVPLINGSPVIQRPHSKTELNGVRRRPESAIKKPQSALESFRIVGKNKKREKPSHVAEQTTTSTSIGLTGFDPSGAMSIMKVPVGLTEFDRVILYDTKDKKITNKVVHVPQNTHENSSMNNVEPASRYKFLFADGAGYKTGTTATHQHAVRLEVHRKFCKNSCCRVMGCGLDPSYKIFQHATSIDEVAQYEQQWKVRRRQALRSESMALRAASNIS
jgi:hypothetical protein